MRQWVLVLWRSDNALGYVSIVVSKVGANICCSVRSLYIKQTQTFKKTEINSTKI